MTRALKAFRPCLGRLRARLATPVAARALARERRWFSDDSGSMNIKQDLVKYLGHDIQVCQKRAEGSGFLQAYKNEMKWESQTEYKQVLHYHTLHTSHLQNRKDPTNMTPLCFVRAAQGYTMALLFATENDDNSTTDVFDEDGESESGAVDVTHSFVITLKPLTRDPNSKTLAFGCYTTHQDNVLSIESLSLHEQDCSDESETNKREFWDSLSEDTQEKMLSFLEGVGIDHRVAMFVTNAARAARAERHQENLEGFRSFFSSYTWQEGTAKEQ